MDLLVLLIIQALHIYLYSVIIYIILGWIPELRRSKFYAFLGVITEPFLRIFRGILVFNGLDLTPMVGIIIFQALLDFLTTRL